MSRAKTILFIILVFFVLSGSSNNLPREITTESGVKMVQLPGGWFTIGDKQVYISSLYIDKYPVTQEEYERNIGDNPSRWRRGKNPVERLTWAGAAKYCNARSQLEGFQCCYDEETWECNFEANGYRLPTEAEWEYAARAGTKTSYSFGDEPKKLKHFAWVKENSGGRTRPVGLKLPNRWGIHDMHGNVWEWCNDFYKVDYYHESPAKNPKGPKSGKYRVVRGGCWNSKAEECRSSYRFKESPGYTDVCIAGYDVYGFRCARVPPQKMPDETKSTEVR